MGKHVILASYIALALLFAPVVGSADQQRARACKQCGMTLGDQDRRFSVIVPRGIEFSAFDDISCAMEWRAAECAMRQEAFDDNALAHDFESGEEIPVGSSFFVIDSGVRTPMGSGIIAFKTRQQAEQFVDGQKRGTVVTYRELESLKPQGQMHHH